MSDDDCAVLVIDDEEDMREMLAFALSEEGFNVVTADSGPAALEAASQRQFAVAITDLRMPGMDGIATLTALKQLDPGIEIIVATGYASDETAALCQELGAYSYIRKPYDIDDIRTVLRRAVTPPHPTSPRGG